MCLCAVSAYWRYFSLCQMGLYFSHRAHPERRLVCATGEPESDEVWEGKPTRRWRGFSRACSNGKRLLACTISEPKPDEV